MFSHTPVFVSDGPALSLDVGQPAANPAALAMAILSSSDSISRTSSNHQVPLVIISQPLPGPITGQYSSPAPPVAADPGGAVDSTVELVLELENISNQTEESLSSAAVTSFPVAVTSLPAAGGPSASEATPTSGEHSAPHVGFCSTRVLQSHRFTE